MKKTKTFAGIKRLFIILTLVFVFIPLSIVALGMYKFNYLASKPGYDVDGNKFNCPLLPKDKKGCFNDYSNVFECRESCGRSLKKQ